MAIAKRAGKVLFYRLPSDSPEDQGVFHRMTNFTQAVTTKNPKEYTRQYVDEESQRVDVVGYASSTAYAFDLDPDNPVHQDLVAITDQEKIGPEAVRELVLADLTGDLSSGEAPAVRRSCSVLPDEEGDGFEAYCYTGSFKANGEKVFGTAQSSDGWQTLTFTPAE